MDIKSVFLILGISLSLLLLIAISGRKHRNKKVNLLVFIAANAIYAASVILYPFETNSFIVVMALTLLVIDIIAIRKKFSKKGNTNLELHNAWHDNPNNWRGGVFYYNPEDTRIFTPKRIEGFGWTLNFANPYSILVLIALIAFIVAVMQV